MKPHGAEYSEQRQPDALGDAAAQVFQHLGEASRRLMDLQAQAAALVLMDSTAHVAGFMSEALRNVRAFDRGGSPDGSMRGMAQPMAAWLQAAGGLQAVMLAGFLQSWALAALPLRQPATRREPVPERRVDSVVIQFPDRRRRSAV